MSRKLLLLALVLTIGPAAEAQLCSPASKGGKPPFSLTINTMDQQVASDSLLKARVTLTNISDHDISIWKESTDDEGGTTYKVEVHYDNGKMPPETKLGVVRNGHADEAQLSQVPPDERHLGFSGACLVVKSGKSMTEEVSVSRLYDLSKPGKYVIQVSRVDEVTGMFVKSNAIAVTVTP